MTTPAQPREAKLLLTMRQLKAEVKKAQARIHNEDNESGVEDQLVKFMQKTSTTTLVAYDSDTMPITAVMGTLVESEVEEIDQERLKKALGATTWNKLTTASLDKKKLQDAMARGVVDPNVVAQCSSPVKRKPYVKITEKGGVSSQPTWPSPSTKVTKATKARKPVKKARKQMTPKPQLRRSAKEPDRKRI
jgi:hypothetical protein